MGFQILTSITDTEPDKWNRFVMESGGSVFHSYEWLLTYEQAAPHDSKAFHIVMSDDSGNWLGLIPCFATQNCTRFRKWRLSVVKNPTTIAEPILLSHSVYSFYGYPLAIRPEKSIYLGLLECYRQLALEQNIPVYGFTSVPETQTVLLECLRETGFTVNFRNSSSLIDVSWNTYQEYVKTLSMRRNIQWMENRYRKRGVELSADFSTVQIDQLSQMINGVLEHHNNKISTEYFPKRYLESLITEFKDKLFIVKAASSNNIFFMNLCLCFGNTLVPWVGGINYKAIGDLSYHHFYGWMVKYAIENGYSTVDCGRNAFETKKKYGYHRVNLYFCLNSTDASLRGELLRWTNELEEYSNKNLPK